MLETEKLSEWQLLIKCDNFVALTSKLPETETGTHQSSDSRSPNWATVVQVQGLEKVYNASREDAYSVNRHSWEITGHFQVSWPRSTMRSLAMISGEVSR